MRFSIYLNPQTPGAHADGQIIEDCVTLAKAADANGFAGICLTQHHFSDYNTYADSMMFGSYLAAVLKQSWVLMQIVVAPLLNPLTLAERANLLDQLLKGRLIVGIGTGGAPLEFDGFGRSTERRYELTKQVMDIAAQAWDKKVGDPPLSYQTDHDSGVLRGRIMPSSYTSPHPHLARGGLSEGGWREAGELGRPLFFGRVGLDGARNAMRIYNEALEGAGHDEKTKAFCRRWTTMQKTVMIAQTDEDAHSAMQTPLANILERSAAAFAAVSDEERKKSTVIPARKPSDYQKSFVEGATIIGSPSTFLDEVRRYEDAGVEHLALHIQYGEMPLEIAHRTFDLFVDKVMPHFPAELMEESYQPAQ